MRNRAFWRKTRVRSGPEALPRAKVDFEFFLSLNYHLVLCFVGKPRIYFNSYILSRNYIRSIINGIRLLNMFCTHFGPTRESGFRTIYPNGRKKFGSTRMLHRVSKTNFYISLNLRNTTCIVAWMSLTLALYFVIQL